MKHLIPLFILPMILLACDSKTDESLTPLWPVPKFELTDQDDRPFSSDQLKGKTWIATLFFTTCNGPCPMMAMRLREIQQAVNDPNVRIVSISCDPVNDTPAKLKEYATTHEADPERWIFLTGKLDNVQKLANDLKLGFEPATADTPLTHSTKFLLVDGMGRVRGVYTHDEENSIKQLQADAAKLAQAGT